VFSRELPGRYTAKLLYGWAIRSMTGSIGKKWKKIGNDGKGTHS